MTNNLRDIIMEMDTIKVMEAHANHMISDEELLNVYESGLVHTETIQLYADVLARMEEGNLTAEDQYMIFESLNSGEMDLEDYQNLVEHGLIDMDMTKEFLLESFLMEAGAAPVKYVFPQYNGAQQTNQNNPQQAQNKTNATPVNTNNKKTGTWQSVKNAANNVAGHVARGVGYAANKMGANRLAAKAYKFASNRFNSAGNTNRANQAYDNRRDSLMTARRKRNAKDATQTKINNAQQANQNNTQQQQNAQQTKPTNNNNAQQKQAEGLDYSLLFTRDVSALLS